jgi:hypothetical protein
MTDALTKNPLPQPLILTSPAAHTPHQNRSPPLTWLSTYKFEHVPVKDVVIGKALTMEECAEQLA